MQLSEPMKKNVASLIPFPPLTSNYLIQVHKNPSNITPSVGHQNTEHKDTLHDKAGKTHKHTPRPCFDQFLNSIALGRFYLKT